MFLLYYPHNKGAPGIMTAVPVQAVVLLAQKGHVGLRWRVWKKKRKKEWCLENSDR